MSLFRPGLAYLTGIVYLLIAAAWQVTGLPVPLVHVLRIGPLEVPEMTGRVAGVPLSVVLVGVGGFVIVYGLLWWIAEDLLLGALLVELHDAESADRHPLLDGGGLPITNVIIGIVAAMVASASLIVAGLSSDLVFLGLVAILAVGSAVAFDAAARASRRREAADSADRPRTEATGT